MDIYIQYICMKSQEPVVHSLQVNGLLLLDESTFATNQKERNPLVMPSAELNNFSITNIFQPIALHISTYGNMQRG